ncbi:hypothetical protein WN51_13004 [Melipona quadrifasciata]|uniref:Uncharacterized protein n=1 Tax=Melipona quadrifasciata TaxID=166423 RepID=A0A0M9AAH3_9HYME|nr:hypothetical protein WN51_13004 [Melipona quadrifasciata]
MSDKRAIVLTVLVTLYQPFRYGFIFGHYANYLPLNGEYAANERNNCDANAISSDKEHNPGTQRTSEERQTRARMISPASPNMATGKNPNRGKLKVRIEKNGPRTEHTVDYTKIRVENPTTKRNRVNRGFSQLTERVNKEEESDETTVAIAQRLPTFEEIRIPSPTAKVLAVGRVVGGRRDTDGAGAKLPEPGFADLMGLRMKISLYGVKGFECVDRLTGLRRVHRGWPIAIPGEDQMKKKEEEKKRTTLHFHVVLCIDRRFGGDCRDAVVMETRAPVGTKHRGPTVALIAAPVDHHQCCHGCRRAERKRIGKMDKQKQLSTKQTIRKLPGRSFDAVAA